MTGLLNELNCVTRIRKMRPRAPMPARGRKSVVSFWFSWAPPMLMV